MRVVLKTIEKGNGVFVSLVKIGFNKFYACAHAQPIEKLIETANWEPDGFSLSYTSAQKKFRQMAKTKVNFEFTGDERAGY